VPISQSPSQHGFHKPDQHDPSFNLYDFAVPRDFLSGAI
jgi:hypothetical protein